MKAPTQGAEAPLATEELLRFVLEATSIGIWNRDFTTGALTWSAILESQYGLKSGTFAGTLAASLERVHPQDREALLETIALATRAGTDFSAPHRALWPDGTVRWLNVAGRIYVDEHGEPVRGVGISVDVTERRRLEEQHQQILKMEPIGRLAGGVAHDFNNLLMAILGYCELLLANLDPADPHRTDIAEIQRAATSGAGLTRQLMAFGRKEIVDPTRLDLNPVLVGIQPILERLLAENIRVVLNLEPRLAAVKADRVQVEQIVLNLAVNAGDAMPGGGTLTIETAHRVLDEHDTTTHLSAPPGSYVVLRVTDTGSGMTPQVQARLFEPFFTTKERGRGTGLGLTTVHDIVTRNGGGIEIESAVGRGTSVSVHFAHAGTAEMVVAEMSPLSSPRGAAQTVLVVDDAEGVRTLAGRLLQQQGYTVLVAANADEALQLFEQHSSIDVLLTDVVMPGASGPELIRQLVERRPALKAIYMSGYTEDVLFQRGGILDPGIVFLHKPFTSETLGRRICEALAR
jgi:two-component system, cell cycle sensor histidine kinase and response regulator CckA